MSDNHIRRPSPRLTRNQSYSAYRRMKNEELRADYSPGDISTYCGALPTTTDWGRRESLAKKYAAQAELECCASCLAAARTEAEEAA